MRNEDGEANVPSSPIKAMPPQGTRSKTVFTARRAIRLSSIVRVNRRVVAADHKLKIARIF